MRRPWPTGGGGRVSRAKKKAIRLSQITCRQYLIRNGRFRNSLLKISSWFLWFRKLHQTKGYRDFSQSLQIVVLHPKNYNNKCFNILYIDWCTSLRHPEGSAHPVTCSWPPCYFYCLQETVRYVTEVASCSITSAQNSGQRSQYWHWWKYGETETAWRSSLCTNILREGTRLRKSLKWTFRFNPHENKTAHW
jgi:hypothetical protein